MTARADVPSLARHVWTALDRVSKRRRNVDPEGGILSRRRSPRHGDICDVFSELVGIAELLARPRLEIEVVLVTEEQYRRYSSDGPWRRKGWMVVERRLVEIVETVNFHGGEDLARLLPPDLPEAFTTADLTGNIVQFVDDGNEVAPSFSGKVNDGTIDSNTLAATVTYNPVNDAPVVTNASLTVNEGQTVTLGGANFSITDADDTSFT